MIVPAQNKEEIKKALTPTRKNLPKEEQNFLGVLEQINEESKEMGIF